MRCLLPLVVMLLPVSAWACDRPVCRVDPDSLSLTRSIGFDDQRAQPGPGRLLADLLVLPGASFGERFEGQSLTQDGPFDQVGGAASAPLTLLPGAAGRNLTVLRLPDAVVLSGDGPSGFPRQDATGEGAIAILFAQDQAAIRLWLRGGEAGAGRVMFLARDGTLIDTHDLSPLAEGPVGFADTGAGMAGVVLTNRDPEGIALDQVDFDPADRFSLLAPPRGGGRRAVGAFPPDRARV